MSVAPVVRSMILCSNWQSNAVDSNRLDIEGMITDLFVEPLAGVPLVLPELCVLLFLVEVRGSGLGHIRCVFEQTSEVIFETSNFTIHAEQDLLDIVVVPLRIDQCEFPQLGLYFIQMWYNDALAYEWPLRVRSAT
jgi:hypothetical protein